MAKTNFYLKDPKTKGETIIYLFFHYNGQRLKYSTGESVKPRYWNDESQKVRLTLEGSEQINNLLDHIEGEVKRIYREALTDNIPVTNNHLKRELDNIFKPAAPVKEKNVVYYFNEFIEMQRSLKTLSTTKKYKSLLVHLTNFQYEKKFSLSFERMDLRFYDQFTNYCINDLKLLNNTSAKYMKMIKTFLKWATDRGYNNSLAFQKFKVREKDADIIYLSWKELIKLLTHNFEKKPHLEKARDIFCLGCFTGLRYSDIMRLKKENIKGDEIRMVSEKTMDNLSIPLNKYAKDILKKYDYNLPVVSNQKANEALKEVGKQAELNESVVLTKLRGVEEIQIKKPKYEFLTTHAARRTFVTLSLEKGMRPEMAMSITGHKDYKTFKKYIKITNKVKQAEMKKIWDNDTLMAVV